MKLHDILSNNKIESSTIKELVHAEMALWGIRSRLNEDERRNPIDAYNDAVTLHRALEFVSLILADPALRFLLGQRLRDDLKSADLQQRTYEAQVLVSFNLARMNEISRNFNENITCS